MNYVGIVLLLDLLILIHEAGHLLAAKWAGIPVAAFSVGIGPKICAWRRHETEYALKLFPLGGFVLPADDEGTSFRAVALPKRIAFFLGGPVGNLLACLPLLAALNTVERGFSAQATLVAPVRQLPVLVWQALHSLAAAFAQPESVTGLVGIVVEGGRLVQGGLAIQVAISLSLSLAVVNLLPIPVLDGGQILLGCLEEVWPRVAWSRVPATIVSLVLLATLILYFNARDLARHWILG